MLNVNISEFLKLSYLFGWEQEVAFVLPEGLSRYKDKVVILCGSQKLVIIITPDELLLLKKIKNKQTYRLKISKLT